MSAAWARPGAKCVCIDASFRKGKGPLVVGAVYEIARVSNGLGRGRGRYRNPSRVLNLVGIVNPFTEDGAFAPDRFRPLITRTQEQDVATFRHLLTGAPVLETVE